MVALARTFRRNRCGPQGGVPGRLRSPALAIILVLVMALPAAARDKVFTLRELIALCKSAEADRQGACTGFITGVRHTLDIFKNSLKDRTPYCIPASTANREFRNEVLAWAEKNPQEFGRAAVRGVIRSAVERYPCTGTAPRTFEF